jgi:hypothetical protein
MNLPQLKDFSVVGLCALACLALVACHNPSFVKRTSSDPIKQARLDWNYKTTVYSYQKSNFTGRKWNDPAIRALAEFACSRANVLETNEPWALTIATNASAAVRAGCKDPMVAYLNIKFAMDQTNSKKAFNEAFSTMADAMNSSSYPPIRKFYASLRAEQQYAYTFGYGSNVDFTKPGQLLTSAREHLANSLTDKTMPPEEVYEACSELLYQWPGDMKSLKICWDQIEKPLFANWPDESRSWLLKGEAYNIMASNARGAGYAETVTEEGWKGFSENLAIAETSLKHAWELNPKDPRIAVTMIWIVNDQGKSRDQMELWFQRAMENNPNDYEACQAKLNYIEPKWHGSIEAMLEFGRMCATNRAWGAHVPLILLDAHKSIQRQYVDDAEKNVYWKQPEVWADIKVAFGRFFELNPDAIGWYHDYAWYAYQAGQWDTLNEIIPKLGRINYSYFGGKDEFDRMVRLAKEHASSPKTEDTK